MDFPRRNIALNLDDEYLVISAYGMTADDMYHLGLMLEVVLS